jgi:predicted HTH transcriptional regulator
MGAKIHESVREDMPQYPPKAVRETVINAIVHADYSMKGSRIQIAIFSNRIEITNPGGLPYGQTMALALSGVSKMRNRVIGRLFREVKLIEQLGTGLKRIISVYEKAKAKQPLFEELNTHFRVTLYGVGTDTSVVKFELWEQRVIDALLQQRQLSTAEIAKLWKVTTRTARTRLKKMIESGIINRIATSAQDPYALFKLKRAETKQIKYKGCDISYTIYPDYDNRGKYVAYAWITIHAKDTTFEHQVFPKEESYASSQLAEIEIIKESKKQIDDKIDSGETKPIRN